MTNKEIETSLNYYSGYFEAMFWADVNGSEDVGGSYDFSDINKDCLVKQIKELDEFFELADEILEETDYSHKQACRDFYFTRCGHGIGFWENDHCNQDQGEKLTEIAKQFGEVYISENDGKIYLG